MGAYRAGGQINADMTGDVLILKPEAWTALEVFTTMATLADKWSSNKWMHSAQCSHARCTYHYAMLVANPNPNPNLNLNINPKQLEHCAQC